MRKGIDVIRKIREEQLTRGIRSLAVLGFFALMGSLSRVFYVGWKSVFYLHIALYLLVLGMALFNARLSFLVRSLFIVGTAFVIGITGLASWGLAGFGLPSLFAFCILSTMLFGTRAGVISSLLSIAAIGMIGTGILHDIITFDFDAMAYLTSFSSWLTAMLAMTMSAGLIVLALATMNRQLVGLVDTLETRNGELLKANRGLEESLHERARLENERRKLEAGLQQAQKMELVGTLAGGVAHDLNNVLAAAVSYPELLLLQIPQASPLRRPIETIKKSGLKAAAIVHDLLTLAKRTAAVTEVTNLNSIVGEYLTSPEFEKVKAFHPQVNVEIRLEEDLMNIAGSPLHLMKTLMNLVSNAAEAMPNGGKILIATGNRRISRPVRGYEVIEAGDYAVLIVSDSGTGISPEDKGRIFEPFYTKKVMGKTGTGLGMTVVWSTVKDHKGHIDMESQEGKGTTFTLHFPITRKPLSQTRAPLSVKEYSGKGESILVVDDVEEQREIASTLLSELGYSVNAVSSGEEALDYLKNSSADLIILDMIMAPGMDGLNTYREIIELRPGQKAIIVSGFSETDRVREAQGLGAGAYLNKPYLMENVGLAVRAELDGP